MQEIAADIAQQKAEEMEIARGKPSTSRAIKKEAKYPPSRARSTRQSNYAEPPSSDDESEDESEKGGFLLSRASGKMELHAFDRTGRRDRKKGGRRGRGADGSDSDDDRCDSRVLLAAAKRLGRKTRDPAASKKLIFSSAELKHLMTDGDPDKLHSWSSRVLSRLGVRSPAAALVLEMTDNEIDELQPHEREIFDEMCAELSPTIESLIDPESEGGAALLSEMVED